MSSSTVKYVTRDQVFTMTLSGLMPLTVHYVYMDNNLIASSKIKPQGGNIGDTLKTDQNGQVTFNFYYSGGLMSDSTPWAESEKIQANLAASKKIVVANKSTTTLDIDYTSTYLSYASITIKVDVATSTTFIPTAAIYQTVEVPGPVITQTRAPPPSPPIPNDSDRFSDRDRGGRGEGGAGPTGGRASLMGGYTSSGGGYGFGMGGSD